MSLLNSYQNEEMMKANLGNEDRTGHMATSENVGHSHTEHRLTTKEKIKEKIHKVKDKLQGKEHDTECSEGTGFAHTSQDFKHGENIHSHKDLKHESGASGENVHNQVHPVHEGHVPTAEEFTGTGLGMTTAPTPGCRFHGLARCECPGVHFDHMYTSVEYCNDLRCHALSPCAAHPMLPKHHHHGDTGMPAQFVPGAHVPEELMAEERLANRRPLEAGGAGFHERATSERGRQPDLRREEMVIERRPITNPETYNATVSDDLISIPLYEEQVIVEKRLVPREEIIVRKREVMDTKTVTATLRSEVADIKRVPGESQVFAARELNRDGYVSTAEKAATGLEHTGVEDSRDLNRDGRVSLNEKVQGKLHSSFQQVK